MRRTFSKNGLEETWEFYQETQGPKTLQSMPEAERQVCIPHHGDHAHQHLHSRCNSWCGLVQITSPNSMSLVGSAASNLAQNQQLEPHTGIITCRLSLPC